MKIGRRQLLKAALGASQFALLEQFGLGSVARAQNSGVFPKYFVQIYIPGGIHIPYMFLDMPSVDIAASVPSPYSDIETVGFAPEWVTNLDGTGDAPNSDGLSRLRVVKLWDSAALGSGMVWARTPLPTTGHDSSDHGYAFEAYGLHENISAVQAMDIQTASHFSGEVAAKTGVASETPRSPSALAYVARHHLAADYPLPAVHLSGGLVPPVVSLPAQFSASHIPDVSTVDRALTTLRTTLAEHSPRAWNGINDRMPRAQTDFSGTQSRTVEATAIEQLVLERIKRQRGRSSAGTDQFLEQIHDSLQSVSRVLARDVVTQLESTPGVEYLPVGNGMYPDAYWGWGGNPWGSRWGSSNTDSGHRWDGLFSMALKLLKSGATSSVSMECRGLGGFSFDTHNGDPADQFIPMRALMDIIGRFLGEMKMTPTSGGRTLLDDTLVLVNSEFCRTWPSAGGHHPYSTVLFAGGGIRPNTMIGRYVPSSGFSGSPVNVTNEEGTVENRQPIAGDVIATALTAMGVGEWFIPGGPGYFTDLVV